MRITADTTDDQIIAGITAARQSLAEKAADPTVPIEDLVRAVNGVANAEGRHEVQYEARNALAYVEHDGVTFDGIIEHLYRKVTNGPNDTYSGRGNDARRSHFEGVCDEVKTQVAVIREQQRRAAA